jgi:hypothetical protein
MRVPKHKPCLLADVLSWSHTACLHRWPTKGTSLLLLLLLPLPLSLLPLPLLLPRPLLLLLLPPPAAAVPTTRNTSLSTTYWLCCCCNCCFRQSRKLPYLSFPQRFNWLTKP